MKDCDGSEIARFASVMDVILRMLWIIGKYPVAFLKTLHCYRRVGIEGTIRTVTGNSDRLATPEILLIEKYSL